jgi:hypothetical protein
VGIFATIERKLELTNTHHLIFRFFSNGKARGTADPSGQLSKALRERPDAAGRSAAIFFSVTFFQTFTTAATRLSGK